MNSLILIRHGETLWNAEEIFRGRADIELNDKGRVQAKLLAGYLADVTLDRIYSSPAKRAMVTAEAIATKHGLAVLAASELVDLDFGQWQGLPVSEVKDQYRHAYQEWLMNPQAAQIPGGESLEDVRTRSWSLLEHIMAQVEGTVALVSHRVVNKVLICGLLGLDNSHFWNIRMDTCGVTTFEYKSGQFVLVRHNDTSFLKPLAGKASRDF